MNANIKFRFQHVGEKFMLVERASGQILRWANRVDMRQLLLDHYYYGEDMELEDAHFAAAIAFSQINHERNEQ